MVVSLSEDVFIEINESKYEHYNRQEDCLASYKPPTAATYSNTT